mgnify:CR=1 FL=1
MSLAGLSLSQAMDAMAEGVFVVDASRRIALWNKAMELLTGYSGSEAIGQNCSFLQCEGLIESSDDPNRCPLRDHGEAGTGRWECLLRRRDGEQIPVLKNACLLKNADGQIIGPVETIVDLRPLKYLEQQVAELDHASVPVRRMGRLVGKSHRMQTVYERIHVAANSQATVLILGETGTGKELVAEAIHFASVRKHGPFVRVNCSALSENLLESELFGHVQGAFTGAIKDKMGRFEAADKGTILLDEIGDISPSIQLKLLRVLQEREIEPVGTSRTRKVDVRIIAATNKDMRSLVRRDGSEKIYITASGSSKSTCRRSANTRRTFFSWQRRLWNGSTVRRANRSGPSVARSGTVSWTTAGRGMSVSWKTPLSTHM